MIPKLKVFLKEHIFNFLILLIVSGRFYFIFGFTGALRPVVDLSIIISVVINFILQALKQEDLTVYDDGLQTRSLCFISDLIAGISKYPEGDLAFPFNLSNDTEFRRLELAKITPAITKSNSQLKFYPLPSDDHKKHRPDLAFAKAKIENWQPLIPLREGIEKMSAWLKPIL